MAHEFSFLFFIASLMFPVLIFSTADSNIYVQCSQLNFTSTTPYGSNVNSLFTSLIDSASLYNFNEFQTSPQNDGVYGLFQCRGDVTPPNCKECVASAVSQLQTTCPMSTGGEIQLEGCFMKYDNTAFFGAQEKTEVCKRCGPSIGYNLDVSNRIDGALANLVGANGQYFRVCDFGSLLGVAQCVQDLSLSDCQDCLSEASERLRSGCKTSTWGDIYMGKCYILYLDQGNGTLVSKGNSSSDKDHREYIATWIGGIGTAITALVGLVGCGACIVKGNDIIQVFTVTKTVSELKESVRVFETFKIEIESRVKRMETVKPPDVQNEHKSVVYLPVPAMPMPPPCPYGHANPDTYCY